MTTAFVNISHHYNGSSSSFNDTVAYTPLQATLIGVSAGILSLVTIAGNFMVMISFKMDKQLQTISNYFLFSLAIADIIIGAISMPLFTVFLIQQHWTLGRTVCDSWLSVDYLASNASVLNLLVISFDRYFSVTRPLTYRARRTTRKAALMIFSAWAISAVVWPPWIIAWPYIEGERKVPDHECYIQFIYSNEYMSIVTVMIAFFVPVTIMIGLYIRVWWETVKRQRELVHLQAGKRASSKRSDSSDETMDDHGTVSRGGCSGGVFRGAWRANASSAGSNRSKESQDVTYMPTSMFRSRASANSLSTDQREQRDDMCSILTAPFAFCCAAFSVSGLPPTAVEDASSEGYTTPRSLETPVQMASKCPSLNYIRDPYATRLPPLLRHSASIEERTPRQQQQSSQMQRANSAQRAKMDSEDGEGIYTILIRFPPKQIEQQQQQQVARRVPSIQMLLEEDYKSALEEFSAVAAAAPSRHYPRSLPIVRRFEAPGGESVRSAAAVSSARSSPSRQQLQSRPPVVVMRPGDDKQQLPLDARLVPRQLVRSEPTGGLGTSQNASLLSVASSGIKRPTAASTPTPGKTKKASSEKKQDRKAAKTLSAILLAFIVTWTPYSVLVVINAILGKEAAEKNIPSVLWDFAYYLCYINSTVNPMLYALCNAAFRRTYVRILTCRWGSRSRQPVNRYYYG